MKKKIMMVCLCVMLMAIAVAGTSLAYFTDAKTAKNTFTMGNVEIELDETDVNNPDKRVTENEYEVYPGMTVTKDPTVHNVGANDAYIRAIVTVQNWMVECTTYFPDSKKVATDSDSLLLIVDALGEGWSVVEVTTQEKDVSFVLKYDKVLESGKDTTPIFKEVTIPTAIKNDDSFGDITVQAEAIQAEKLATWEEAFAEYDAQ